MSGRRRGWTRYTIAVQVILVLGVALGLYVVYLDKVIRQKFDGKRWALPAVVYARPLELYPELPLTASMLAQELQLGGYRRDKAAKDPGGYDLSGNVMHLVTRDFAFADGVEKSARITVEFGGPVIKKISATESGAEIALARIDPARIGSFHPLENEDRLVYSRKELPDLLVKTLLAVEDQHFYTHSGVDPWGILRAMFANIRAGKTVQGGSTLTQQLVKNFFLNNERTLQRKFNEVIMALLLERHYSKDEILTAYANEIFLGQDRGRAVHGFGLASQFYFRRDLKDLSAAQIAMMVGMIKGPSYYDPRRYADRCLQRRQVILEVMRDEGVISDGAYLTSKAAGLEKSGSVQSGFNRYPAFLDLVRRQLGEDYREEDLTSNGLKILTTLDPQVQMQVERNLRETVSDLEKRHGVSGFEGAVIVSSREGGEILAVAGGRDALQPGFNRALDAQRPIGSLIKPLVYLTALANGYTLASPVQDTSFTLAIAGAKDWRPANYDKKDHGIVPFHEALANSYNLATIKIGMDVGVEKVVQNFKRAGINRDFKPYPSFLLGTAALSPLEVAQMYQLFATGGFYQPQRSIGSVLTVDNKVVQRFGLTVEQRFSPQDVFLLNTALKRVISNGTARSLLNYIPETVQAAGKTGTTDELRDSWFAGFTGDRLAVVWIGRDDNKPTVLTGSSGAMVVWGKIMQSLYPQPLELMEPEGLEWARVDGRIYGHESGASRGDVVLPFVAGTVPRGAVRASSSGDGGQEWNVPGVLNTIRDWFH
ncbi:MAG: penicillin-binding protein 1B [Proteobacteria bacterium]|nr:penicillin-binding protein 1B [Pseudomonadota bacterium]MBU1647763.1 penicillin-binding protein 1B [Pseudomonadota bacterium]